MLNAASFETRGFSRVLAQEEMTPETLTRELLALYQDRGRHVAAMQKESAGDGIQAVLRQIYAQVKP